MADFFDFMVGEINSLFYGPGKRKGTTSHGLFEKNSANEKDLEHVLHVKSLDLQIETNTDDHHTDKYDCTKDRKAENGEVDPAQLVLRRGGEFEISVTFNRPYSLEKDDVWFIFITGKFPQNFASTHGKFQVDESGNETFHVDQWCGRLVKRTDNTARFRIQVPVTAAIGEWSMVIQSRSKVDGREKKFVYEYLDDIYILFNPWCKDDPTFLDDTVLREEYVLNDNGCVFKGTQFRPRPKPWNFGQFEDGILEASCFLMNKVLKPNQRHLTANPVQVARNITQVVNSYDEDRGVLYGNWSGDYSDATSPNDWYGSVRILRKYIEDKKPVRYGQCWVFSGVTTTVCRALGLPTRSVTNYSSAHDTDGSCTIDKFYDGEEPDDDNTDDSIWNFHVWNEVWMKRPDIPSNGDGCMDGWQAIDSTPQELSEKIFRCGPCPLYAVKHGMVATPYDGYFIFAEVNSDIVHWMKNGHKGHKPFKIRTDDVGKKMSTKTPDGKPFNKGSKGSRLDVTDGYKYPEGTAQNSSAVARAAIGAKKPKEVYGQLDDEDVEFKLLHDADIAMGDDVPVRLTARNTSKYTRNIKVVNFQFCLLNYTGRTVGRPFKTDMQKDPVILKPNEVHEFKTVLDHTEYLSVIDDSRWISIFAFSMVVDSKSRPLQHCVKQHSLEFGAPELHVQLPDKVKSGDTFEAVVTFNNPLKEELTDCKLGCEGRGFPHMTGLRQDPVPRLGSFKGSITKTANRKGTFTLVFKFTSKELRHLSGSETVVVE